MTTKAGARTGARRGLPVDHPRQARPDSEESEGCDLHKDSIPCHRAFEGSICNKRTSGRGFNA
jgi:hypothetical protein